MRSLTTTPYNPQANGEVERMNSTLENMLAAFVNNHQNDWDKYLQVVAHSYRTTVNTATGFTPFRLIYGREARLPSSEWIEDFSDLHHVDINGYAADIAEVMQEVWHTAAETIQRRADQDEANKRPSTLIYHGFVVGDYFYKRSIPKRFYTNEEFEATKISAKLQY